MNFEKRKYSLFAAYGQSKAMMMMFSFELAHRLEKSGVTVNALHPGSVRTDIAQKSGSRLFVLLLKLIGPFIFITPEQSGTNIAYVTTSPDLKAVTGQYFDGKKRATPEKFVLNQADWAKVWQITQTWLSGGRP